jgi:integrase
MTNNRGTITKRNDSWGYAFSYTNESGTRRWVRKSDKRWNRKDAQQAMTEALARVDAGHDLGSANQTLASYLNTWIKQAGSVKDLKPGTIHQHHVNIDSYIVPRIGNLKISALKPIHLRELVRDLQTSVGTKSKKILSPKTVRNIFSTLSCALNDAVRSEILVRNPCTGISLPKWERPELRTWDGEDVAKFIHYTESIDEWFAGLYRLALIHGLRRGELAGLRWSDVNFETATITIEKNRVLVGSNQVTQSPKTSSGRRTIAIDSGTLDALNRLQNRQLALVMELGVPLFDLVGTRADGKPVHPDRLLDRYRSLSAEAGLPKTRLHDARHAAATMMLSMGSPLHVVSAHLGHSKPSITLDIYAHALPKADRLTADALGSAIDALISQTESGSSAQNL